MKLTIIALSVILFVMVAQHLVESTDSPPTFDAQVCPGLATQQECSACCVGKEFENGVSIKMHGGGHSCICQKGMSGQSRLFA